MVKTSSLYLNRLESAGPLPYVTDRLTDRHKDRITIVNTRYSYAKRFKIVLLIFYRQFH